MNDNMNDNKFNEYINKINCEYNVKDKLKDLPKESYDGNVEYKLKLTDNYEEKKYQKLATQMKYRLNEGKGKAIYIIGVCDNGNALGINYKDLIITLEKILIIVKIINAEIKKITKYDGKNGIIITMRLTLKV